MWHEKCGAKKYLVLFHVKQHVFLPAETLAADRAAVRVLTQVHTHDVLLHVPFHCETLRTVRTSTRQKERLSGFVQLKFVDTTHKTSVHSFSFLIEHFPVISHSNRKQRDANNRHPHTESSSLSSNYVSNALHLDIPQIQIWIVL